MRDYHNALSIIIGNLNKQIVYNQSQISSILLFTKLLNASPLSILF